MSYRQRGVEGPVAVIIQNLAAKVKCFSLHLNYKNYQKIVDVAKKRINLYYSTTQTF